MPYEIIPAHPLALTADRKLDERRQRALTRYYIASGVTGIAVGVHTTQFAIRESGLLEPVLRMAREELGRTPLKAIAGVVGPTAQALREAELAAKLGYNAVLLSLGALVNANTRKLIDHTEAIASILPVVGFYLQPSVGGRILPYEFWRKFVDIENVVAIKVAPFNRYQTLDVMRAVAECGRPLRLYTGNDDNIIADLVTEYQFGDKAVRFHGGLLGHLAVWTKRAAELIQGLDEMPLNEALRLGVQITDANAAFFDSANGFRGCIAGLHEVLRRQGLLEGRWCLDPNEGMSAGQSDEIDRVYAAYPHLNDDAFVQDNLAAFLR